MGELSCSVRSRRSGRTAWISVDGQVDRNMPRASAVLAESIERKTRIAVLDLSRAKMINSEGLNWLDDMRLQLDQRGIKLRVVAPEGGKVRRILSLMQYDKAMLLLDRVADALRVGKKRYLRLPRRKKLATAHAVARPAVPAPTPAGKT